MRVDLKCLIIILAIYCNTVYALPCPNGGGILYKGDTIATTIQQCGKPDQQEKTTRVVYSADEWIYYRPHVFDPGYVQLVVRFNNDIVSSILINNSYPYLICQRQIVQVGLFITYQTSCGDFGYYTNYTNLCGFGFGVGSSKQLVQANCGLPAAATPLGSQTIEVTNLIYGGQTIVFQNGKLIDFQ